MIQFNDIMKSINVDHEMVSSYRSPMDFLRHLQKINEAINADPGVCLITVPYALSRLTSENGKDHLAEIAQLLMEERNFGQPFDALHAQSFLNGVNRSLTDSFTATQEDRVHPVKFTGSLSHDDEKVLWKALKDGVAGVPDSAIDIADHLSKTPQTNVLTVDNFRHKASTASAGTQVSAIEQQLQIAQAKADDAAVEFHRAQQRSDDLTMNNRVFEIQLNNIIDLISECEGAFEKLNPLMKKSDGSRYNDLLELRETA